MNGNENQAAFRSCRGKKKKVSTEEGSHLDVAMIVSAIDVHGRGEKEELS